MRFLIYGGNGWIGNQIQTLLLKMGHEVFISNIHIEQSTQNSELIDEIQKFNVDRLICTLGRTSGATKNNIDYLEDKDKLPLNLRDNLMSPLKLAYISDLLNIHMVYLGTGCIYHYDATHVIGGQTFTEDDPPNFYGSQYSVVKGLTDILIRNYKNVNYIKK